MSHRRGTQHLRDGRPGDQAARRVRHARRRRLTSLESSAVVIGAFALVLSCWTWAAGSIAAGQERLGGPWPITQALVGWAPTGLACAGSGLLLLGLPRAGRLRRVVLRVTLAMALISLLTVPVVSGGRPRGSTSLIADYLTALRHSSDSFQSGRIAALVFLNVSFLAGVVWLALASAFGWLADRWWRPSTVHAAVTSPDHDQRALAAYLLLAPTLVLVATYAWRHP